MNPSTQNVIPPLAIDITVDGRATVATTTFTSASAHVLTVSTVIGSAGIEIVSTYAGAHDLPESGTMHLLLLPGVSRTWSRRVAASTLPVWHHRRLCLYDHLQQLHDAAAASDIRITSDVGDDAVTALESAL